MPLVAVSVMLPPLVEPLPLVTGPVNCTAPPPLWLNVRVLPTVVRDVTVVAAAWVLDTLTLPLPLLLIASVGALTAKLPAPLKMPATALRFTVPPVTVPVPLIPEAEVLSVTTPLPPAVTAAPIDWPPVAVMVMLPLAAVVMAPVV